MADALTVAVSTFTIPDDQDGYRCGGCGRTWIQEQVPSSQAFSGATSQRLMQVSYRDLEGWYHCVCGVEAVFQWSGR